MTEIESSPLLEARGITKQFPGVLALHNVGMSLRAGEILAVMGENGAGKSTLMKILAGVQTPDEGQLFVDGRPVTIDSVEDALEEGVALIHQELNLADNLDVASNIFLGREPRSQGLIDDRECRRRASDYLKQVGLDLSPKRIVGTLSIGQQQMVEIAKALSVNARVLIMDEPTSSLSQSETEALFRVVHDLRQRGVGIVYISHRLAEVSQIADRVVVLRDGENAGELAREEIAHDRMVKLMVGRDISGFYVHLPHEPGAVVLEARDLVVPEHPTHPVSFSLRAGEIVGMAGLIGAGRTELLRVLFGVTRPLGGTISSSGRPVTFREPFDAIKQGIALVPEDRKLEGLVLEMSVRENVGLAGLFQHRGPWGWRNGVRERDDTTRMVERLNIKTPTQHQIVQLLSGGNQQKVVLGKWLALGPKVLLLDEPTRGIDVGAKQEIYRLMEELAQQGVAILFVSSDLEEILSMSDRTLVMHEGAITGELAREELNEEAVMRLATGATAELTYSQ
ncbi:Ribose import ATP-binding protein RbsA [Planctomycetes bacterium Pan216]|uniref:Ribose import ATP-binding protein RbsA n=1 Tax=Kolteria novifilia TaxID=2527975 RepID=A0A518BBA8_9BACT|nr:Ribose import ATP-binding protein RbsA [Planctomycetes bacterium Pan216]